jgi:Ca2+-binding RTX toxin-like protein
MSDTIGSANDDTLTGTGLDDTLTGLGGDDVLSGGAGNDTLHGDGEATAADYAAAVAAADPVAWWRFGESGGNGAADASGNGHTGTYKGGVDLGGPGIAGGDGDTSGEFDGYNEYVEIAHGSAFLLDSGTITLWFRPDDLNGDQCLFSKNSSGYDNGGHLDIEIDGSRLKVRLEEDGYGQSSDETHYISTGSGTVQQGVWQQLTFTWGAGGMKLYLDGALVGSDSYTGGLGSTSGGSGNTEPIVIGASQADSGNGVANNLTDFFDGDIDEVAIFGEALSAAQIAALYEAGTDTAPPVVPGDDVLDGGAGDDTLSGGAGNDILDGGSGADVIDGGEGTDTADYSGADGTVIASLATGFAAKDGQGAIDSLTAVENLTGGDASDILSGDAGDNTLTGGLGDDILSGGHGNDTLSGGGGSDTAGFVGDDAVVVDLVAGTATGQGDDTLDDIENVVGSAGDDTIAGDGGDNVLVGGQGADMLSGGAGDDILIGDNSAASVVEAKTLIVNAHGSPLDGVYPAMQVSVGGIVVGTAAVTASLAPYSFDLSGLTPSQLAGEVRIVFTNDAWDGDTPDNSFGPDGDEDRNLFVESIEYGGRVVDARAGTLSHDPGGDGFRGYQSGGEGDTITDIHAEDVTGSGNAGGNVYGGRVTFAGLPGPGDAGALGDDSVAADGGDDLLGGLGNDILYGMAGDDTLDGGIGSDFVYGGAGNDTVIHVVEAGSMDVYRGGSGADILRIELTAEQYADPAILTDIAQLRTFIEANSDAAADGGNAIVLAGLGITVGDFEDIEIVVDGVPTLPPLFTEGTNDPVDFDNVAAGTYLDGSQNEAYDGDDIVTFASSPAEAIEAGYDPALVFHAGAGNDTLTGRGLDDRIAGDTGDDIIFGGGGWRDELDGGEGNDVITDDDGVLAALGGAGNDTITLSFVADWDDDGNVLTNPQSAWRIGGGTGSDIINVTAASLGFYIALNADGADADPLDGDDSVTLAGLYAASLVDLGGGDDTFIGGIGADIVYGGEGGDDISGGAGNDLLYGGGGDDTLRGGLGVNLLAGGSGNDTLIAGNAGDTLDGGEGADTIVGGAGNDTILFNPGTTAIIDAVAYSTSDDASISGGGGTDTLVATSGNDLVDLNESRYEGNAGGIERFELGSGDDRLIGGFGDSLDDQISVLGGDGSDEISLFFSSSPSFDLSHIDPAYNAGTWTISFTGQSGAQSVDLTQAQVTTSATWDPAQNLKTIFDNANFTNANFIDGGVGTNTRVEGTSGSNIVFGGDNAGDPAPDVDFDDFLYSTPGDDILVGGSGYDVYYVGRGQGDNFIFDGNEAVGGFANGLILFAGFDDNGDSLDAEVNGSSTSQHGITFANNGDGTWTISFNSGGGSVTFAGEEISDIDVLTYNPGSGVYDTTAAFSYDSNIDDYV